MRVQLSPEERSYLDEIIAWDEERRATESIVTHVSLVFGGVLIAVVAFLTILDLRDVTVFAVLVPGFLAGLFLIAIYLVGRARVNDRHRIALLARKLVQAT